jgi:sulfur transfer complex TusBCD TusB component (DsrH family)
LTIHPRRKRALAAKVVKWLKAEDGIILKDDRVLIFEKNGIYLASIDEVLDYALTFENILYRDIEATEVIGNIEYNIYMFKQYFHQGGFDLTIKSITLIDEIYPKLIREGVSESELLLPITTYIGEVIIEEKEYQWHEINNRAVLVNKKGSVIDILNIVLGIISSKYKKGMFSVSINYHLGRIQKLKPSFLPKNDKKE